MKPILNLFVSLISLIPVLSCNGQKTFGNEQLTLKQTISLPGVEGRIDHMDVDLRHRILYMCALGNNSLEAVDLASGKVLHSVKGMDEPQGNAYIPQTGEIIVANGGDGNCRFYNAETFNLTATIALGSDADDVRYDSTTRKIYVGYGEGGIAVIDAVQHNKVAEAKLPAHPEGFQLDKKLNRLFVNVPDAGKIFSINLTDLKTAAEWKSPHGANFPMAIDEEHDVIFIGCRRPAKVVAINVKSGQVIAEADLISDVDDVYFDSRTNKVYASGGGGAINIFSYSAGKLQLIANIPTRSGARTSLLIPALNEFVLAERSNGGKAAQLSVFELGK